MFITLIVSTLARHLNTWRPKHWLKLYCISLILAYITAGSCLFFDIDNCIQTAMETFLSIYRTWSLVSVHFQMNYLIYSFIYKIKGNISVRSVTKSFKTLWPPVLGALLFLSIGCMTPLLNTLRHLLNRVSPVQ